MLYKSVTELIGNTPLIEISKEITKLKNINVYAKCELYNPFGSLKDRAGYAMLKDEIQKLKENKKISYLFISHDINIVKKISDRLLIIKDGEIIESGSKEKIFSKPEKEYTKKLIEISGINLIIDSTNVRSYL